MVTSKELQWRQLDEVINSVRLDFRAYEGESQIDTQDLIKIIQECNALLGLPITKTKETILEIEHGRAKLPADFHFLNFALLCYNYTVITPEPGNGIRREDHIIRDDRQPELNITTVPCWTVHVGTFVPQAFSVTDSNGITTIIDYPAGDTKICAMNVVEYPPGISTNISNAVKGGFCYNNPDTGQLTCNAPTCACSGTTSVNTCTVVDVDPWNQNKVYSICNDTVDIRIVEIRAYEKREYRHFERLYMMPSRWASAFTCDKRFRDYPNHAMLRDGFLVSSLECGRVYINYQGIMEDDEGNLLVIDHPLINQFYEFAMKKRILENLYLNGEPDLERRLQYVQVELDKYRHMALTVVNTPDHRVMTETFNIIRRHAMERFAAPLSRFYGEYAYISFVDSIYNRRYCE